MDEDPTEHPNADADAAAGSMNSAKQLDSCDVASADAADAPGADAPGSPYLSPFHFHDDEEGDGGDSENPTERNQLEQLVAVAVAVVGLHVGSLGTLRLLLHKETWENQGPLVSCKAEYGVLQLLATTPRSALTMPPKNAKLPNLELFVRRSGDLLGGPGTTYWSAGKTDSIRALSILSAIWTGLVSEPKTN